MATFAGNSPGVSTITSFTPRMIWATLNPAFSPTVVSSDGFIAGALTRDPGQTPAGGSVNVLREGLLLGKVTDTTSTYYGQYGNSIIGITKTAASGATTSGTIGTTAEVVAEVTRLMGTNSTYNAIVVGPPTATGTVAVLPATFSASTGTSLTYSANNGPTAAVAAGSYICPGDGRYLPLNILSGTFNRAGLDVVDLNGSNLTVQIPQYVRDGDARSNMIINLLTDDNANSVNAPCTAWVIAQMPKLSFDSTR